MQYSSFLNIGGVLIRIKSDRALWNMTKQAVFENFIVRTTPKKIDIDLNMKILPHYIKYKQKSIFMVRRKYHANAVRAKFSIPLNNEDIGYLNENLMWRIGRHEEKILIEGGSMMRFQLLVDKYFRKGRLFIISNNGNWKPEGRDAYHFLQVLRALLICYLPKNKLGLIIHSAGVRDGEQGYLFTGPSSSGKSTISKIWSTVSDAQILSDENIIMRRKNSKYFIYSTPWHSCYSNYLRKPMAKEVPVAKFFHIYPSKKNIAKRIEPLTAFVMLYQAVFSTPWDAKSTEFISSFCLNALSSSRSLHKLGFRKDEKIIQYVRDIE